MEEHIKRYHPLGAMTLLMMILKRSLLFFVLLLLLFAVLIGLDYVPAGYFDLALNIVFLYIALLGLVFLGTLFLGWLEYFRYWIFVDQKDLKIRRGMIATEEIGIPYRRIRDVKINRSLLDQILGMSNVTIMLSDYEDNQASSQESIIFLPLLDKKIASEIQDHILKRSQVEQISILATQSQPSPPGQSK